MAEIHLEKKTPIWPWILLAVAVIAILIYFFAFHGDDEYVDDRRNDRSEQTIEESVSPRIDRTMNTRTAALNNPSVSAYVDFIQEDTSSMGLDHDFTNEALSKLTAATQSMANEVNYDIQKDLDEVKTHADKITREPFETTHANSIRKSADILGNVLQNIQQNSFPDLTGEVEDVKNAATAIKPETLTLNQKEDVKKFFKESADLLEKMNSNSPKMNRNVRQR